MNSTAMEWTTETYRAGDVGIRSVPPDTLVCFTVDSCPLPDSSGVRCDNKVDKPVQLRFDYRHDTKTFRSEMEAEFLTVILQHLEQSPLSKDAIELSDIAAQFDPSKCIRNRFGLLNTQSKAYKNLLQGFQEGLEEELRELVDNVNKFIKLRVWKTLEEQIQEISIHFQPSLVGFVSKNDPRCKQSAHALKGAVEPYKLPRLSSADIPESLNVENSFNGFLMKGIVENPLVCDAMKILLKNPLGVSPARLESELRKCHLLKTDIEIFLGRFSSLFLTVKSKSLTLVFPNWGKDILPPYSIGKNVFHKILILLKLSSDEAIPMQEIPARLEETLGIRFSPYAWGSNSDTEFYKAFLRDYDIEDELEIWGDSLRLVVPPEPDPIQVFREKLGVSDDEAKIRVRRYIDPKVGEIVPGFSEFASANVKISSVAADIKKGRTYFVLPDFILTPMEIHVSLEQNWELREAFLKEMTAKYDKWNSDPDFSTKITVLPDFLEKGSHVALKYLREWTRGKIIEQNGSLFTVHLVDIGGEVYDIPASEMKYLHRDFLGDSFSAQTFPCSLRRKPLRDAFPGRIGPGSIEVPVNVIKAFQDLIQFRTIGIVPLHRVESTGFWTVDAFLVDNVEDRNIIVPDLVNELAGRPLNHSRPKGNGYKRTETNEKNPKRRQCVKQRVQNTTYN